MSTKSDLLETLRVQGLTEYGSLIPKNMVCRILELDYPERATKAEFDSLSLRELAGIDYVRNALLSEGKYLANDKGDYRVLLPSQNAKRVELYMNSADKKLRRAIKLSRNTPHGDYPMPDGQTVKAMMKRESIKSERSRNELIR